MMRPSSMQRWKWIMVLCIASRTARTTYVSAIKKPFSKTKLPEASSTLLKMQNIYATQPPHDPRLYDVLCVSPKATSLQIQKAYRRMSVRFHPDKFHHHSVSSRGGASVRLASPSSSRTEGGDWRTTEEDPMDQIQKAYDVLKHDSARLPYHKYGLVDTRMAVYLLTGYVNTSVSPSPEEVELMRWMGFYVSDNAPSRQQRSSSHSSPAHHPSSSRSKQQRDEQRIVSLAYYILERIRPLVEGVISDAALADIVAQECDRLKRLPLGAHIIRCIGRSFRHSGRRILRQHHRMSQGRRDNGIPEPVRSGFREAKHYFNAVVASGRAVVKEQIVRSEFFVPKTTAQSSITYHNVGELIEDLYEDDEEALLLDEALDDVQTREDIQKEERHKANKALLETLQIEALWKISKISLSKTIREACDLILDGRCFFFPFQHDDESTSSSSNPMQWNKPGYGWVGASGQMIDARVGRLRAAAALVMLGDVMVKSSKENTSWME